MNCCPITLNYLRIFPWSQVVFQSSVDVLSQLTEFFDGLSHAQSATLLSRGLDLQSRRNALNAILLNHTTGFVNAAKEGIKEEFLDSLNVVKKEARVLNDTIEGQKNVLKSLNTLSDHEIDKSLAPLHLKLKEKK